MVELGIFVGDDRFFWRGRDQIAGPKIVALNSFAPLFALLALVVLAVGLTALVCLGNGRYAKRLIAACVRIPRLRRIVVRSYVKDLEKANPAAARASRRSSACPAAPQARYERPRSRY
jgi:hypothetical protein